MSRTKRRGRKNDPDRPLTERQRNKAELLKLNPTRARMEYASMQNLATHLLHEPKFPKPQLVNRLVVQKWIKALNTGLAFKHVIKKSQAVMEKILHVKGYSEAQALQYQADHPTEKAPAPDITHPWTKYAIRASPKSFTPVGAAEAPTSQASALETPKSILYSLPLRNRPVSSSETNNNDEQNDFGTSQSRSEIPFHWKAS